MFSFRFFLLFQIRADREDGLRVNLADPRFRDAKRLGDFVAKTPIGEHDHVRIGSVTKTFTVTTLLRMADAGVVSLDDHVSRWVPGVPNGEAITLRMLANMTSGLGSYTFSPTFQIPVARWRRAERWTRAFSA